MHFDNFYFNVYHVLTFYISIVSHPIECAMLIHVCHIHYSLSVFQFVLRVSITAVSDACMLIHVVCVSKVTSLNF